MKRFFIATVLIVLHSPLPASAQTGKPISVAELAAYNKPDREKVLWVCGRCGIFALPSCMEEAFW